MTSTRISMVIDIDDEDSQRLLRLFNTADGQKYLKETLGLSDELIEKLTWMGISGIANVLCCIKMAKYYELTENDVVCTVLTDSAVMSCGSTARSTTFSLSTRSIAVLRPWFLAQPPVSVMESVAPAFFAM